MQTINRMLFYLFLLFLLFPCSISESLFADVLEIKSRKVSLNKYLLPNKHPLYTQLKHLFEHPDMFETPDHLRAAGFQVINKVHRKLMVATHPSIKNYLFKKFQNCISKEHQLRNYLSRIDGARALSHFIAENHLQHIVVPKKWIYPLPKQFSNPITREKTYILIVEKIDICSGGKNSDGEVAKKYYNMDKAILKELCMVIYQFRGLDSMLHNMPFTHQNKIAFIDTEKWNIKREGFLRKAMPFLSKENQTYALSILKELQDQDNLSN